ncbi:MAG: hypothetical protein H0T92_18765, partial [Pyrinomonadaceae bacterium]|nr:hypothetical protein [Pyrinomonadaceae bacterium]
MFKFTRLKEREMFTPTAEINMNRPTNNVKRSTRHIIEPVRASRFQWRKNLRLVCSLMLSYILILCSTGVTVFAQTGPQPGLTDPLGKPAGRYMMLPDHKLAAFISAESKENSDGFFVGTSFNLFDFSFDTNLNPTQFGQDANLNFTGDLQMHMAAAAGRILQPDRDQVVYATRDGNTNSPVRVGFHSINEAQDVSFELAGLPRLVDRPFAFNYVDPLDVAVGDLDKIPDAVGNNHDEVVVAFASPGLNNLWQVNVAVLDYTSSTNPQAPTITTTTALETIDGNKINDNDPPQPDVAILVESVMKTAVGDFDGDGVNEIAVVFLINGLAFDVTIFRYGRDAQGNRFVTQANETLYEPTQTDLSFAGTIDVAAGDYNGDGKDELVISTLEWRIDYVDPNDLDNMTISTGMRFVVAAANPDFSMNFLGRTSLSPSSVLGDASYPSAKFDDYFSRTRIAIVPGLFKFDPANSFDLNRRQFVAVWNPPEYHGLSAAAFSVSDDLLTISMMGSVAPLPYAGNANQQFSVAAGAFKGNSNIQNPEWSLAVSSWSSEAGFFVKMFDANASGIYAGPQYNGYAHSGQFFQNMPLVAYDATGDSLYLGAPVHMMVEGMINTDFILQEPPKHAFYDNRPGSPTYGQIVTVTRFDETNVSLRTSTGTTFSGKSTDSSNWSIGASVEGSAGESVKAGIPDVASAKASFDLTAKIGYDYNQNKDSYNSNYSERTVSQTESTDHDDKLLGRLQTFDIWRYRVYGASVTDQQDNPTNAFYDFVLPGPIIPFNAGGLDFDWYQPLYENGNILSYPQATSSSFTPSDVGAYKIPCPATPPAGQSCNGDGTLTVVEPMVPASL